MKKFRFLSIAAAALMMLGACSDDKLDANGGDGPDSPSSKGDIYMSVNFQLPGMGNGARSFTNGNDKSSNGVEIGSKEENGVTDVLVILARPADYGYIASAKVSNTDITTSTNVGNPTYRAVSSFTTTSFDQYYNDTKYTGIKGRVAVFLVVNPNLDAENAVKDKNYGDLTWFNAIGKVTETKNNGVSNVLGSIWEDNKFLMSNQYIALRSIPNSLAGWNYYTSGKHPFHLSDMNGEAGSTSGVINNSSTAAYGYGGPIKVERAAARFDFRDGSGNNNTYHVVYDRKTNGEADQTKPLIDIKLFSMSLTNMNNSYYIFNRVSDNGLPKSADNNWELCGPEKPWFSDKIGTELPKSGNYVVDVWAQEKSDGQGITSNFENYFNYPFFDDNVGDDEVQSTIGWYTSKISAVLGSSKVDNWEGNPNGGAGQYKVWRYLTENTIPGIEEQTVGQSTIVVFKGRMDAVEANMPDPEKLLEGLSDEEKVLVKASAEYENAAALKYLMETLNSREQKLGDANSAPIIYSCDGVIYASWELMRKAALQEALSINYNEDKTDFTYSWNHSGTLYSAVYGKGYDCGVKVQVPVYEFYGDDNSGRRVVYKEITDGTNIKANSPNALWEIWDKNGRNEGEDLTNFRLAATSKQSNITIYQRSQDEEGGWGYYCYYYYKNRHNDNGKPGTMGPMEFAVVRNNVYKLAVTKINALGHPRIFNNDPLSPKPTDPDESEELTITVDAEVLPWVVRVNDIEF